MATLKKPYEISLWEDILTFVYEDGSKSQEKIESEHGAVVNQYYEEQKICIIGSDTMDTPVRAFQPKLVSKVNGENILTFDMYSHYYDEEVDGYLANPFIGLLINERKIKLRYGKLGASDTKWYDLIVKNVQENSETKTYSYIAKDQFVNELSKSGFNLVFNNELENNTGNIDFLAEKVLEESDWKLRRSESLLKQTINEPLYAIKLNQTITGKDMESDKEISISAGKIIYGFYNNIVNQDSFLQFLYAESYEEDDDHVITNSPNWGVENVTYGSDGLPAFAATMGVSSEYRGRRLVRKVASKYDSTIDKYVNIYKDGNQEVYGYTETEYTSPAAVRSYVTNPNSYDSYIGWEIGGALVNGSVEFPKLSVVSVPDVRDLSYAEVENTDFTSCLKLEISNKNQVLYNSGIVDYRQHIDGFVKDEQYVFRVKYGKAGTMGNYGPRTLLNTTTDLTLTVREYELVEGRYVFDDKPIYFSGTISSNANGLAPDYKYVLVKCEQSLSYSKMTEMGKTLGLFIQASATGTIYIEDIQFFPYVNNNGLPLLPSDIKEGDIQTIYYYYLPNKDYKNIEEVNFIYKGDTPASFAEVYNNNGYEKIRSITASESNRFNLIQELSEIFECWPKFEIEHDPQTGKILLDENYRQKKWVSFHEYIGNDNYTGFKYGINLKSIQRTIESEGIVSKLVVKDNSNEFATDGACSIARATENPSGENFILDFSYYIQQNLLGMSELTNDLYSEHNGFIGYYSNLKRINTSRDQYIKEQSGLITDISQYSSAFQTYSLSVTEAEKQLRDKFIEIKTYTSYTFEQLMTNKENEWWNDDKVVSIVSSIGRLKATIKNHKVLRDAAEKNLQNAEERYDLLTRILSSKESSNTEERLLIEKEKLHAKFYKKYSRFLQEGSWISEDYIDDNLYFLDAQSTLYTSAKPKIVYNISVLELSSLEEYQNYTFALGDKTTIEDTEFFGWVIKEGIQTPYREEIVVTELTISLDSPEQNQIKVQNYKTQFEDLFQRMAATTQSVEYSTGKYQKVASIIDPDGTINITTLQNSIANNALTIQNSKDQSVIWDDTGITTTSASDPANVVRIVNGGIFLSTDGGITWNTGITGKGISASYITSGMMNVEEVNILNKSFSSFRWDKLGISAFEFTTNRQTGEPQNFNHSKFVRLDQYGLYGINGYSNFDSSVSDENGLSGEDKIWKYSNFALTWKGFQIKSSHVEGGYISITSNDDLQVINAQGTEQVKLGLLYNDDIPIYGLRLSDNNGVPVMEHASDGKVWIRDELQIGIGLSSVTIGYLKDTKKDVYKNTIDFSDKEDSEIHQVINANNKFMVYEDGSMKATDGEFTGVIHATGGTIGGLDIDAFPDPTYEVIITSDNGSVFKDDTQKVLTAHLYKGRTEITKDLTYQWYKHQYVIEGGTQRTLTVKISDLEDEPTASYYCQITYGE